jgi:AAA domain
MQHEGLANGVVLDRGSTSMDSNGTASSHLLKQCQWIDHVTLQEICSASGGSHHPCDEIASPARAAASRIGLVLLHAGWNRIYSSKRPRAFSENLHSRLKGITSSITEGLDCEAYATAVQVDETPESLNYFLGDDISIRTQHSEGASAIKANLPNPPSDLPVLCIVVHRLAKSHLKSATGKEGEEKEQIDRGEGVAAVPTVVVKNVLGVTGAALLKDLLQGSSRVLVPFPLLNSLDSLFMAASRTMEQLEHGLDLPIDESSPACHTATRIFVAGDRSSVGKSSVCLGMLGSLLEQYDPSRLAYIKPATQSESPQLIEAFCRHHGITCVPIGPLVYYRGFTRAFLAGETGSSDELLLSCVRAVDRVARGKDIVLVDGVGFPAVGSICGTDNATVARACGYLRHRAVDSSISPVTRHDEALIESLFDRAPLGVVLVGGSGVGGAVDAFNLNATYFESRQVPVLGAIFNKLEPSGYYSLENCRDQITRYFEVDVHQKLHQRRPFGFLPVFPAIAGLEGMKHVDEFISIFRTHVDVDGIVQAARGVRGGSSRLTAEDIRYTPAAKRFKIIPSKASTTSVHPDSVVPHRTRQEIENQAIDSGAAPSA